MDQIDRKILAELQADPELAIHALAERVGLSQTPCWRRLRKLEAEGIILGRVLLLDPARLGYPISVYVELKLNRHDDETLGQFEDLVSRHPQIVECFAMSGQSDFIMRILARSVSDYEQFARTTLLRFPAVSAINSSFALKTIKLDRGVPMD
ncbi:Lrp/AsnC family transcriptional regulator [Novosphingobium sp. ERN07]|uniref:Lrp/AsnC family transcriptional regulator n=1 Tax=unclassified Novosphingobium TaxID=2644732 RepID=UPI00061C9C22|nr:MULTISPECIES: Lrp/AsnC family transcriptional regulator [unclassified Novosphingobium]AXU20921.1 AsnC family transcriptional regulator [Novosphingobium sp. THN1]NLR41614.1 Lrp/AsnC family transcriptional regulator [Novosphingobium sp. ERW19]NLR73294.1 Lrp/AsnC family transcriptional regulator [Novosphingobium sp. ERN07]GAO56820.1 transcriptional regulator of asnC family [Novosphingobium sp. MD-1]